MNDYFQAKGAVADFVLWLTIQSDGIKVGGEYEVYDMFDAMNRWADERNYPGLFLGDDINRAIEYWRTGELDKELRIENENLEQAYQEIIKVKEQYEMIRKLIEDE